MAVVMEPSGTTGTRAQLKGLNLAELESWSHAQGEPAYRGGQLFEWLYGHGVSDPAQMDNLPRAFRQRLAGEADLTTASILTRTTSSSGATVKYLLELTSGGQVETVSMVQGRRHTLCVSSQVGCNVGCDFCATARMGLLRNLTAGEIVDQYLLAQANRQLPVTNVVFMGMGEPLLNYRQVLQAADIFHHPKAMNLGAGRITISTAGVVPRIEQFVAEERPYRLAISLNATTDASREQIMPINATWPLPALMKAARAYANRPRRTITFEYVLLEGLNDTPADAARLVTMLKGLACKVNVIPYNDIGGTYRRPKRPSIDRFVGALRRGDFPVLVRWSHGSDMAAGCGQLVTEAA